MEVCVHTNDKKYELKPVEASLLSSSLTAVISHATKPDDRALGSRIWDDAETVYWKQESSYDFLTPGQQTKLVKLAFLEASMETPLVIRRRRRSTADAQIKINWLGGADVPYFKDSKGTLAFAYGPAKGIGGDITMNSDNLWLLRSKPLTVVEAFEKGYIDDYNRSYPENTVRYYDPLHTMKHEGGHAIGLRHITNEEQRYSAVMFPYYSGLRTFGTADKIYLHDLYGKASVNHKIKEMILNRIRLY